MDGMNRFDAYDDQMNQSNLIVILQFAFYQFELLATLFDNIVWFRIRGRRMTSIVSKFSNFRCMTVGNQP